MPAVRVARRRTVLVFISHPWLSRIEDTIRDIGWAMGLGRIVGTLYQDSGRLGSPVVSSARRG
jgi:hypothetical protein